MNPHFEEPVIGMYKQLPCECGCASPFHYYDSKKKRITWCSIHAECRQYKRKENPEN